MAVEEVYVTCVCGRILQDADLPRHFEEFLREELGQQAVTLKIRSSSDHSTERAVCIRCRHSIEKCKGTLISYFPGKSKHPPVRSGEDSEIAHRDVVRGHFQYQEVGFRENLAGETRNSKEIPPVWEREPQKAETKLLKPSVSLENEVEHITTDSPREVSAEIKISNKAICSERRAAVVSCDGQKFTSLQRDDVKKHQQTQTEGDADAIVNEAINSEAGSSPKKEQISKPDQLPVRFDNGLVQIEIDSPRQAAAEIETPREAICAKRRGAVVSYDGQSFTNLQSDDAKKHQQTQTETEPSQVAQDVVHYLHNNDQYRAMLAEACKDRTARLCSPCSTEKDLSGEALCAYCPLAEASPDVQKPTNAHSDDAKRRQQIQEIDCSEKFDADSSNPQAEQISRPDRLPENLCNKLDHAASNRPKDVASENPQSRKSPCVDCHVAVVPCRVREASESSEADRSCDLVVQVPDRCGPTVHQGAQTEPSSALDVGVQTIVVGAYPLEMGEFERLIAPKISEPQTYTAAQSSSERTEKAPTSFFQTGQSKKNAMDPEKEGEKKATVINTSRADGSQQTITVQEIPDRQVVTTVIKPSDGPGAATGNEPAVQTVDKLTVDEPKKDRQASKSEPDVSGWVAGPGSSSSAGAVPKSLTTCYICGELYGSRSIKIHEPQCLEKWRARNEALPPEERIPEPTRPASAPGQEDGSDDDAGAPEVDPASLAAYKRHQGSLVPCRHCSRTFSPGRVQKHEASCIDRPRSSIRNCVTPSDGNIPR